MITVALSHYNYRYYGIIPYTTYSTYQKSILVHFLPVTTLYLLIETVYVLTVYTATIQYCMVRALIHTRSGFPQVCRLHGVATHTFLYRYYTVATQRSSRYPYTASMYEYARRCVT